MLLQAEPRHYYLCSARFDAIVVRNTIHVQIYDYRTQGSLCEIERKKVHDDRSS